MHTFVDICSRPYSLHHLNCSESVYFEIYKLKELKTALLIVFVSLSIITLEDSLIIMIIRCHSHIWLSLVGPSLCVFGISLVTFLSTSQS